ITSLEPSAALRVGFNDAIFHIQWFEVINGARVPITTGASAAAGQSSLVLPANILSGTARSFQFLVLDSANAPIFLSAIIAVQRVAAPITYVNSSATGAANGQNWTDAFSSLEA